MDYFTVTSEPSTVFGMCLAVLHWTCHYWEEKLSCLLSLLFRLILIYIEGPISFLLLSDKSSIVDHHSRYHGEARVQLVQDVHVCC
jgi:hypothetical protein